MATEDVALSGLTEATQAANGDFLYMEASGGPRRIQRNNLMPRRGSFAVLADSGLDIANDRVWVLDATDGSIKETTIRNLIFGNFGNVLETDDFTLTPGTHNVRPVQLGEALPDVVSTVTLNGNTTGIAGCSFLLVNTRNAAITVAASNITLYVGGSATDGSIPARQMATIVVSNAGTEAFFEG